MLAWCVAKSATLFLILVAGQRRASSATVGIFRARDANICHLLRAVRRADAAADIMEVIVALGVPESTELFATLHWMDLTGSTTIRVRLVAVSSIITEASIMRAILPAYGPNTTVAILAVRVA